MSDPHNAPVSQSPLIAALSTPSSAMFNPVFPVGSVSGGPHPNWTQNAMQTHEAQVQQATPVTTGGPIRVNHQIRPGSGPYPRIAPGGQPIAQFRQVTDIQPHPGHVQRPLPPGPPGAVQVQMHPQPHPMHPQPMPMGHSQLMMPATSGSIIDKARLDDLMKQIEPSTVLEDNVKEALMEYTDEFVRDIIEKVCTLVHHRGNNKLETRDVELVLEMVNKMPAVPRAAVHVFGHQPQTVVPKIDTYQPTEAHKQRLMLIKKQIKKL